ncbi:hypothetical protein [Rubritalea sp.]|uniref:hypothetical protein n=1 Tax=Rubritalea sp. TaxID=2109375 RepID=UPI003EF99889
MSISSKDLKILFWLISLTLLTSIQVSCYVMTSPEKRVSDNRGEIEESFQKELRRQMAGADGGELKVNWNQALEKMYMDNPRLLQADFKVEDAVNQQKRVWTGLIPLVSVGVSDSFELENIDEAFDDINLRVYSYLPLGEVVRLPKQIYTKKLLYMGSQLNAEQTMRQEVIALYRLFQRQYLLELEKRAIMLEGELTKGLVNLEDADALKLRADYLVAYQEWETRYEDWRIEIGDFFMSDYRKVELNYRSLPDISYRTSELDFTDSGRWGMLQLNLLALEKISEDAEILDTYLRFFPSPNFNVTAPPLYSDTANSSFDPEEISFGPSLNWSIDTRGTVSEQLNRIKREKPLSDWRKDKRKREEISKLVKGKQSLLEIQTELKKLRSAMKGYRKAVQSGLVDDPRKAMRTMRSLREREVRLAAKEIEIYTSFWLIDESRWAKTTKRWQETRVIRAKQRKKDRVSQEKEQKEISKR